MNLENLHINEYVVITNPVYKLCGVPLEIVAIQHPNLLAVKSHESCYSLPISPEMNLTKCNDDYVNALKLSPDVQPYKSQPANTYVHLWNPYG